MGIRRGEEGTGWTEGGRNVGGRERTVTTPRFQTMAKEEGRREL